MSQYVIQKFNEKNAPLVQELSVDGMNMSRPCIFLDPGRPFVHTFHQPTTPATKLVSRKGCIFDKENRSASVLNEDFPCQDDMLLVGAKEGVKMLMR